ncbi:phospholipase A1-like [Calliopsis andreniformis]|uniref:phospholipase A1-like n=1 Tax=Calliopsis andreniformis TaxID=337506 RepID=UPI003FCE609A
MTIKKNYSTAVAVALFLFISVYCSQAKAGIIPNCVFGIKSLSFILYTRSQPQGIKIQPQANQIPLRWGRSGFFIHGFVSQANGSDYYSLIRTWLQEEDINIFSVDWDNAACYGGLSLTDYLAYGSAVKNVHTVGADVANFIARLSQKFGVKVPDIVIFGHSLGAHVAGFVGKAIQRLTNQKVGQIIGLDPAGPLFRGKGCGDRLCSTDASFLQVLHTSEIKGHHNPLGHIDFYFHGGTRQPMCSTFSTTCDHGSAVTYATMSIMNPKCYLGTKWQLDSSNILSTRQCNPSICSYVGLNAPRQGGRGLFYVAATATKPYCSN